MKEPGQASSGPGLALAAGDRLGPYEIVALLGTGGMGEVYRARDSRLRREVAIKVLHASLALTPEHVERLSREARAAGSLNHPNIVAVFDVGTEGPLSYVVSELLKGESLRARLLRGPLPYRKALEYGIQLAHALGAAHEKGIWHRDVKPANTFVTADGRVKLLDFGLVKLKPREGPPGSQDSTADVTETGGIHGTQGYMSPEQVLGEVLDQRSDIFALGAVLFEMFTGRPAFRRRSVIETTKAVLNEDPAEQLERTAGVSPAAAAVIRRCLEKNKEERFQSARDLAFHLEQLHHIAVAQPALLVRHRSIWRALLLALLAACALAAVWFMGRSFRPPAPTFEQLTFRRVRIGGARFASQDGAVVYSEARDAAPLEVWWLGGGETRQPRDLRHSDSDILAARGGRLALSLGRRYVIGDRFVGTLAEAPLGEGSPRQLADNVDDADWDPSGSRLAIARWATSSAGGQSRLEYPPGTVLYTSAGSLRYPRFSRDGRHIAFLEDPTGRASGGRIAVVDLAGAVTALTDNWPSAHGLAWSATGKEIWFAAGAFRADRSLRAVDLSGHQRVILGAPASVTLRDIAIDGTVLLSRDDERTAIMGMPPGETLERDLSWFDTSGLSDVSDDGSTLLFSDRYGVYIRNTDGSAPTLLGLKDGFADDLSADGKEVLATTAMGDRVYVLPAGPGDPVPLPVHGMKSYRGALWVPGRRQVLFNATRPGSMLRSYLQDLDGGLPRPFTTENTWAISISLDGKTAACMGPQGISLWPIDGGPTQSLRSSEAGDRPVTWSADNRSVFVFRREFVPRRDRHDKKSPASVFRIDLPTGVRHPWKTLIPPDPAGVYSIDNFKVTPDERAYFYSYKRSLSQLYAVTGLE